MRRNRIAAAVDELREQLLRPRFLRIVATIKVHDRRPVIDGTTCECCGSPSAVIVQELPAADLVIDLADGRRIAAADTSPDEWAEMCSLAGHHEIAIRCSTKTLPLLLDETDRHIFASGGNRAAKTTTGLAWMVLQWLRRGGRERRFWLVATTDAAAFRLLEKLFKGTGESPAILPAALIERSPDSHRASNLQTRFVDGSLFDLRSFAGDPTASRTKSDAIVAALVDEAAHLPSESNLAALRGRCVDAGGRLWLASTPRPASFLKAAVVDQALEFERLPADDPHKLSGQHEGAAWLFAPLPLLENPWISLANIERDLRTLDMSKPANARDFAGAWVADSGLYWADKFYPDMHTFAHEHRDLAEWSPTFAASVGAAGHVPITGMVRRRICSSPGRNPHHGTIRSTNDLYIVGQDRNWGRMESVLVQVTAPPGRGNDPDSWHLWVMDCVTSRRSGDDDHAAHLVSVELSRALDPRGSTRTLDGALVIVDPTAPKDVVKRKNGQSGSIVDAFARHNLEARCPVYKFADGRWKWPYLPRADPFAVLRRLLDEKRLHVASRCGPLLEAFATQLADPSGLYPMDGRSGKWDERMGPADALKYVVYAIVNSKPAGVIRSLE